MADVSEVSGGAPTPDDECKSSRFMMHRRALDTVDQSHLSSARICDAVPEIFGRSVPLAGHVHRDVLPNEPNGQRANGRDHRHRDPDSQILPEGIRCILAKSIMHSTLRGKACFSCSICRPSICLVRFGKRISRR